MRRRREADALVPVGRIVGPSGIQGHVRVELLTTFKERFSPGSTLFLQDRPVRVIACAWHKGQARIGLEGVVDRTQAESLRWETLFALESERPKLSADEYLTSDLVGCRVVDEGGREIGQVDEVLPAPAADVLRVGNLMIPAVKAFVLAVDLRDRVITVRLIEGMEEA